MKKALFAVLFAALLCFGLAGAAEADTTSAGGVTYTFTSGGADGSGGFLVNLVIDTTGATADGTLNSFSVQFTEASDVSLLPPLPAGTGNWVVEGLGTNNPSGCNLNGSANHWCVDGGSISVTAASGDGDSYAFIFDVKVGSEPTSTEIQAFQGQGDLAISNTVDIGGGGPPTETPEPASLLLLGLGLAGAPLLRRRRR